jgi:hypothetical protein
VLSYTREADADINLSSVTSWDLIVPDPVVGAIVQTQHVWDKVEEMKTSQPNWNF